MEEGDEDGWYLSYGDSSLSCPHPHMVPRALPCCGGGKGKLWKLPVQVSPDQGGGGALHAPQGRV